MVGQKQVSELSDSSLNKGGDRTTMRTLGKDEDLVRLLGDKYGCAIEDLGSRCVVFQLISDKRVVTKRIEIN